MVADILASPAQLATCTPELNGVGAMPSQELASALRRRIADEEGQALERWRDRDGETAWGWTHEVPPPTRVAPVATMTAYGTIRNLLERGQLVLPNHPDLLRELAGLRYEQGERGLTRIEAGDPGLRDDLADSLALATSPFTPHGRVDCRLARLSRSAIPDADVPAVEDTVTTGGGLVVPRRPFLQSVNGPEVSLPAQLAAPAPPREPDAIERARTYLQTTRS